MNSSSRCNFTYQPGPMHSDCVLLFLFKLFWISLRRRFRFAHTHMHIQRLLSDFLPLFRCYFSFLDHSIFEHGLFCCTQDTDCFFCRYFSFVFVIWKEKEIPPEGKRHSLLVTPVQRQKARTYGDPRSCAACANNAAIDRRLRTLAMLHNKHSREAA